MSVRIINADCRAALRELPDESVHCIVTSPPYWGLRDYGVDGQMGLERSLGEHIEAMVSLFDECRRVLRKDGTCWVNYGDCYATSPNGRSAADTKAAGNDDRTFRDKPFSTIGGVLKAKDLCMVPNRLAIALQEAGWWVRSEIIWAKPNPMPESVTDRPATSHEKIFLLTKSARYFYDAEAVREPAGPPCESGAFIKGDAFRDPATRTDGPKRDKQRGHSRRHAGFNERWDGTKDEQQSNGRNCRNVWTFGTSPFREAHFATFPPELAERCIKAGSPEGGMILDPFGGAGTTGLVADRLKRDAILIELNPDYCAMARRRIENDAGLFAKVAAE